MAKRLEQSERQGPSRPHGQNSPSRRKNGTGEEQQETIVASMEYWEFELLFNATKFVEDTFPSISTATKDDLINDIYDDLYDLKKEIHERESATAEG